MAREGAFCHSEHLHSAARAVQSTMIKAVMPCHSEPEHSGGEESLCIGNQIRGSTRMHSGNGARSLIGATSEGLVSLVAFRQMRWFWAVRPHGDAMPSV